MIIFIQNNTKQIRSIMTLNTTTLNICFYICGRKDKGLNIMYDKFKMNNSIFFLQHLWFCADLTMNIHPDKN
jgi:hypothetical protein